jgi:uncharacterized protein YbaP (TraB family)
MMRLLRHLCVLAFLALSLLLRVAAADAASYDEGLLWRVEMPGRSASYVFGTLHSSESSIVRLPAPVTDAFSGARTFATEVVIDTPAMLRLSRAMLLPKGQSLDHMLTAAQLARLETVAKQYHLPIRPLLGLKPWALMAIFSFPPAEQDRSVQGLLPLDLMLQAEAKASGKALVGLETTEEQIDALDGLPEPDQVALLAMTLDEATDIDHSFAQLATAYLARDLAAVRAALSPPAGSANRDTMARFEARLITERNRRMAQRMVGLLSEGNAFIAVGALHLPGEGGVLALLAAQGYQLTRVY